MLSKGKMNSLNITGVTTQKASVVFMPEYPGSELCPVRSFEKYVEKLHPKCDALWQRPKEFLNSSDSEWYYNAPVGEKTLNKFMKNLSVKTGLSQVYTNHSCRTTGAITREHRDHFNIKKGYLCYF